MLRNKILIIGLFFMIIGNAYAWDEESGYAEGEEMEIIYVEGYDYYYYAYPDDPNWYDPLIKLIIRIKAFLFTDEDIEVDVTVSHEVWNPDDEEYSAVNQVSDIHIRDMHIDKNTTCDIPVISTDPVEEFFKNNTEVIETFTTRDDDPDHPDVLNVSINISGAGLDIHEHGYTSLDDEDLDGINERINTPDYGFTLDGRGAGGSSGSIYDGIDMYGSSGGDTTGMGAGFNTIFWCIIPLVFILAVMKLSSRCLK